MGLLDDLKKAQKDRGLNDAKFAELLGIHFSYWSLVKRGKAPLGIKLLCHVCYRLPELHVRVLDYMVAQGEEAIRG